MKQLMLVCSLFACLLAIFHSVNAQTCQKPVYSLAQVPEATTGFRSPVDFTSNNNGLQFLVPYTYTCSGQQTTIYHPAWDMNYGGTTDDKGLPIRAAARGRIVWIGNGTIASGAADRVMTDSLSNWASMVIQHNYQGKTYFTQYAHAQTTKASLTCGDVVEQGAMIGNIGAVGLSNPNNTHLHYEIRKDNHPNPANGYYFCALTNKSLVESYYENPVGFETSHGAYVNASVSTGVPLAIVSRTPDILDTFDIRSDGALWANWYDVPRGRWNGAWRLTAPSIAPPNAPVSAISRYNTGIDIFWVGSDGAIYTMWFGQELNNWAGRWNGPYQIIKPGSAIPGKPVSIQALPSKRVEIFWVSNSGAIWGNYWDDTVGSWNTGNIGLRYTPDSFVRTDTPVSIVARYSNESSVSPFIDIFYTDSNGAVRASCYNRINNFSCGAFPGFSLTVNRTATPNAPVSVMARYPSGLDIFWRGADGAIWSKWYADSVGWQGHFQIPGTSGMIASNAVPLVQSHPQTRIDVFWPSYDGSLWTNSHNDNPFLNWPSTFQRAPRP